MYMKKVAVACRVQAGSGESRNATILVHRSLVSSGNLVVILCYENKLLEVGHASNIEKKPFKTI